MAPKLRLQSKGYFIFATDDSIYVLNKINHFAAELLGFTTYPPLYVTASGKEILTGVNYYIPVTYPNGALYTQDRWAAILIERYGQQLRVGTKIHQINFSSSS